MSQRGKYTVINYDNSGGTPVDISQYVVEGAGIPLNYDELEVGGYGQDKQYMKGLGDSEVTLKVRMNSTTNPLFVHASTGSLTSDTARTLTVQYGNNAAPTTGDYQVSGEFLNMGVEVESARDGIRMMSIKLRPAVGNSLPAYSTI